jgi:YidC/Oxa1 family membrane protein insertase
MIDALKFLFYYPFLNLLTFFTWLTPGHWVAVAIVLLTVLIRFALLVPTKKQVESQRQITALAPALKELQERFGKDREGLAKAQLKLYEVYRVNPFASCLLLPIQLVVLFILFYAITHGMSMDSPQLYSWVPRPSSVNTQFFWVDLKAIDGTYILAIVATILQYIQIRLTLPKAQPGVEEEQMVKTQRTMMYFLPLVTLWASASFAAGVVLYWITTTIFSIVQQLLVNRAMPEKLDPEEVFAALGDVITIPSKAGEGRVKARKEGVVVAESTSKKNGVTVRVRKK